MAHPLLGAGAGYVPTPGAPPLVPAPMPPSGAAAADAGKPEKRRGGKSNGPGNGRWSVEEERLLTYIVYLHAALCQSYSTTKGKLMAIRSHNLLAGRADPLRGADDRRLRRAAHFGGQAAQEEHWEDEPEF